MADVNVHKISYEIEKFLFDDKYRTHNIEELGKVKSLLSDKNSSQEAAKVISEALLN